MTTLGLAARWGHLGAGVCLVGTFAFLLVAGRSDRPTALAWERRLVLSTRWVAGVLLLSGLASLASQVAVATGRVGDTLSVAAILQFLTTTQLGALWVLRHGLFLLLAGLILLREREESGWDWAAFRGEGLLLAGTGLGLAAWAGHAAAVDPWGLLATGADALHLLAAGIWLGGLLPLGLLLRAAGREAGADARPFAVLAARGFSQVAFVAMLALVATGVWNSWNQVGGFPSLVGTRHGRLLLVKLGLLLPILAVAHANRTRLLPALAGEAEAVGRPAMQRLAAFVALELVLGAALLAVVTMMAVTPPARHTEPWWPFPLRLSYAATKDLPGVQTRLLIGSLMALIGLLGTFAGWILGWRRRLVVSVAATTVVAGLVAALPPLAVEAYPTTYRRASVPYHATSILNGQSIYSARCAGCHGLTGPANAPQGLSGSRLARYTAGDLFWWAAHRDSGRGGSDGPLAEEERWDVVNFLRTLSAAERARALAPVTEPRRPRLVAPDFAFAIGPGAPQSLKGFRGRRVILLVLFSLPESRPRLSRLARNYDILQAMGAEIFAVPTDGGEQIISRLGPIPRILFPVVTEGAGEIVDTYSLFRPAAQVPATSHMEFLIDRQGYLRARWTPGQTGWSEMTGLLAEIQQLNEEVPLTPPADEHVH